MALFDVAGVQQRLEAGTGGYEIVHGSPGLEIGVYVLVAPEPDHQSPHEDDEVYVVLEGRAKLRGGSEEQEVRPGLILFIRADSRHSFVDIEEDLTLLALFSESEKPWKG